MNPYQLPSDERSLLEITEQTLRKEFESRVSLEGQHQRSKFLPESVPAVQSELASEPLLHDANLLVFKREGARLLLSAHWKRQRASKLQSEISSKEQDVELAQNELEGDWIRFENFLKVQATELRDSMTEVDSLVQKRSMLREKLATLRGESEISSNEISLVQKNRFALAKYREFLISCKNPENPELVLTRLKNLEENSVSLLTANEDLRARIEMLRSEISPEISDHSNRASLVQDVAVLETQTLALTEQCDRKIQKISDLESRLTQLNSHVATLGTCLKFSGDRTPEQHLLAVERFVEDFAAAVARLGGPAASFVQDKERRLEKARREHMRSEYLSAANSKMEERSAAALRRAQAPIVRRRGKPLMARSAPPRRDEDVKTVDVSHGVQQELDLLNP